MLTAKWTEKPGAYRLLSKINDKTERRIKSVIGQGRYTTRFDP